MTGDNYNIRSANREELSLLQEIERAAGHLFIDTDYPFIAADDPIDYELLYQQFEQGMVWVASDSDNAPVGFAVALPLDGLLHLEEIAVHPLHGKRGIGTELVNAVCEWAKQKGYRAITLSTFRDIAWNGPFYSRLGFVVLTEIELSAGLRKMREKEAINGLPVKDRVCMRRDL
ncbi:MAG: GNAT family N-acetyltransferase [Blastocatellia bacterium]